MKRLYLVIFMILLVFQAVAAATAGEAERLAEDILSATGTKGGFVLHLGCGDGSLAAALATDRRYIVHGMDSDAAEIAKARQFIAFRGLADRVSVEQFTGERLPFVDNLVNLVVAEDPGNVSMDEIQRVLAPSGVVYLKTGAKWTKTVKPRPNEIDDWTHYMHGSDGNAVAADAFVGPPRRLQWKAGPTFGRHHDVLASISAIVSDGPRIFYIIDEGPTSLMNFPPKWQLVARDAFNGVLLWKKPIPTWANYLRPFRSGPPQLPRRLVAAGGKVYVTLGLDAPASVVDAATGKTLRTCEETTGADEILLVDDVLLVVVCDFGGDSGQAARRGVPPAGSPRSLMAVSADTGKVLWKKSGQKTAKFRPMTLAASADRVVFQRGDDVACLDLKTGAEKWTWLAGGPYGVLREWTAAAEKPAKGKPGKKPRRKKSGFGASYFAPTIVICEKEGVVLASDKGKLHVLSLEHGRLLWFCPCKMDFHAPADVFLADGLVWAGLFATEGRDPKTGEVKRKIDITGLLTGGHHPRCYRNKATDRFIISGKRGYEFFDLTGDAHSRNNWARGGCQYGMMPCNGLTYMPPNACCCYAGAMLHGFYALASGQDAESKKSGGELRRGPAYESAADAGDVKVSTDGWPTFRGDVTRSGSTKDTIGTSPKKLWEAKVGGRLTTPVVAGGKVFVASVNHRRIAAIDAKSGKITWVFTAGGRVDTPPTIYKGLALFGANDGWIYCLRASDGKLAWRFRAAPEDRRTVVDNQLESIWPVHGNVLVFEGVAYFAAGRSPYIDGGIWLYGVDPATGKKRYETRVFIPPDDAETLAFMMDGVRPDILVSDGKYIYLQQIKFDKELKRQKGLGRHVMCHSGLADDTWFYRTFWRLGYGDAYDFPNSYIKHELQCPFGQLLVFDDKVVCGLQTFMSPGIVPSMANKSSRGCQLFGDANKPFTPDTKMTPGCDFPKKATIRKTPVDHKWTARLPFQARAMLLAGDALFVAGWPDDGETKDLYAAIAGKKGGRLWVFSPADGKKLAEHKLESSPVFDGMATASGRLYISMKDGKVACFGGSR